MDEAKLEQSQQLASETAENKQQLLNSPHTQQYLNFMKGQDRKQQTSQKQQQSHSKQGAFVKKVTFLDAVFRHNDQYLIVRCRYGKLEYHVNILMLPFVSETHSVSLMENGSYASVYKFKRNQQNLAVKCMPYKNAKFLQTFKQVIREYIILCQASSLQIGPKIFRPKFEIIIYKNCIEFEMEQCKLLNEVKIDRNKLQSDLKHCLAIMHSRKIIHYDIKPSNICYSEARGKFVFIDFGFSEFIEEEIGQQISVSFRGTGGYCCEQMRQSLLKDFIPVIVDPYYNDAVCLTKSLQEIDQLKAPTQLTVSDSKQFTSQLSICIDLKYQLWLQYFAAPLRQAQKFYQFVTRQQQLQKIYYFISVKEQTEKYHTNIKNAFLPLYEKKYLEEFMYSVSQMQFNFVAKNNIIAIYQARTQINFDIQSEKYAYNALNLQSHPNASKKNVLLQETYKAKDDAVAIRLNSNHPQHKQGWLRYFEAQQSSLDKKQYYLNASRFLSLKCLLFSYQQKRRISRAVLRVCRFKQSENTECELQKVFIGIFDQTFEADYCLKTLKIIQKLLYSVIFLELLPQQQLLNRITLIFDAKVGLCLKASIIVQTLISLEWVGEKIFTKYDYYYLKYFVFESLRRRIQQEGQIDQNDQRSIQFFKKLVSLNLESTKLAQVLQNVQMIRWTKEVFSIDKADEREFISKSLCYLYYLLFTSLHSVKIISPKNQIESLYPVYRIYLETKILLGYQNKYFNLMLIIFTNYRLSNPWRDQLQKIVQLFIQTFMQTKQFFKLKLVLQMNWQVYFKRHISDWKGLVSLLITEIKKPALKTQQVLKISQLLFLFPNILSNTISYSLLHGKQLRLQFFQLFMGFRINLDREYFYKLTYHNDLNLQLQLRKTNVMKKLCLQQFKVDKTQVQRILISDLQFYITRLSQIKCFQCKFYFLEEINNIYSKQINKQVQYEYIFELTLQRTIYHFKSNLKDQIVNDLLVLMLICCQFPEIINKYKVQQVLILLLQPNIIQNRLTTLFTSLGFEIYLMCSLLLKQDIIYFQRFITMNLIQLSQFKKYLLMESFRSFKYQMGYLFSNFLPKSQLKSIVTKNSIQYHKLSTQKLMQVLVIIKKLPMPETLILYLSLVYLDNPLLSLETKKQIYVKMAYLFKDAHFILKQVCLFDYFACFIRTLQLYNLRRMRLFYRKCLPYTVPKQHDRQATTLFLVESIIQKESIRKIKRKKRVASDLICKFKSKLLDK